MTTKKGELERLRKELGLSKGRKDPTKSGRTSARSSREKEDRIGEKSAQNTAPGGLAGEVSSPRAPGRPTPPKSPSGSEPPAKTSPPGVETPSAPKVKLPDDPNQTLQLSVDDLVVVEDDDTEVEERPAPPAETGPVPEQVVILKPQPVLETAEGVSNTLRLDDDDLEIMSEVAPRRANADAAPHRKIDEERACFQREAEALAATQPERASQMWIEAARSAEEAGGEPAAVQACLARALELSPASPDLIAIILRQLLSLRQFDAAMDLVQKLLAIGGDSGTRVAALIEAAAVSWHHQGDGQRALALLQQALELKPGYPLALSMRASLFLEEESLAELAETLELLAESFNAEDERSLCLYAAGTLREMRLGDLERAEQDYQRAVESDGGNLPALLALAELHQQMEKWRALAEDLERMAALDLEPSGRARLLLRAGSLQLWRTGELDAAGRTLAAAARLAPDDPTPLARLAGVEQVTGRQEQLVETLRALIVHTHDDLTKAALLTRIGGLLQQAGALDQAIDSYDQALQVQPDHLPALQALGTLYRQRGDYEGLLGIISPEAEGTDSVEKRALRSLERGEILALHLDRTDDAIQAYRRALELDPRLAFAFWRLRALLLQAERQDDLAALYDAHLEHCTDPRTRHYLLLELARLRRGTPATLDQAIAALSQAKKIETSRAAAIELGDIYRRSGRFSELVELLLSEAVNTADPAEAKAWRMQAAMIFEAQLDEPDRALEIYRAILGEKPHDAGATRAAGQILHRLGRWQDLIALHQQELAQELTPRATAALWCRIGKIYEENMGQPVEAVVAFQEALSGGESVALALGALERLLLHLQRHEELVQILERHADGRRESLAAADALCRAAELADAQLEDLERTRALYQRALERSPGFLPALEGLLDLELRQGHFPAACTLLETISAQSPAAMRPLHQLTLARLKEYRLGQEPDAALYDAAAQSAVLGPYLRVELLRARRREKGELTGVLGALGLQTVDPELATAYLLECAHRHEAEASTAGQLTAIEQAFAHSPEDPAVLWCYQRALRASQKWPELAALYLDEAEQEKSPTRQLNLLSEAMVASLRGELHREAEAIACKCMSIDRHHLRSLQLQAALATAAEDWSNLGIWQDLLGTACVDAKNRIGASLIAAELWTDRVGNPSRALASLERILAADPEHAAAFQRAVEVLQTIGDHPQLSRLFSRRIANCTDEEEKIERLRTHARLLRDPMGDLPRAIAELTALRALAPDDLPALTELAELLTLEKRWSDATASLASLAQLSSHQSERQQARLHEAGIWLDHLHQLDRARELLRQLLDEEPGHAGAKQLMVRVAQANGDWSVARLLLEELSVEDNPALQVWALLQLAEVARVGLQDEELRASCEREAITLAAKQPELIAELIAQYRQRQDLAHLVPIGIEVSQTTTEATIVAPLRQAMARILLEDLQQSEQALELLRENLHAQGTDAEANLLLALGLERQGDLEGAVNGYRQVLQEDLESLEALRGLSRLQSTVGHPDLAQAAAAIVAALEGSDPLSAGPASPGTPPGRLELSALPRRDEVEPLRRLFGLVLPHLGTLFPLQLGNPMRPTHPLVTATRSLAQALGLSDVRISVEGEQPALAGVGDPVLLHINPELARDPGHPAFLFWVGRAIACAATAISLLDRLSDSGLAGLIEGFFMDRPQDTSQQQFQKQIQRALPRRVRKQLEQMAPPRQTSQLWTLFRAEEARRVDQVGIVCARNPGLALAEVARLEGVELDLARAPRLQEMVRFSISDAYETAARTLWSTTR